MGQPQTAHPKKQLLVDFGLGKLDPENASEIETHLVDCALCSDTLLNLKDDTFAGLVRTAKVAPESAPLQNPTEWDESDASFAEGSSETAATMLVQSGDPVRDAELPLELQNHSRYRIVQPFSSAHSRCRGVNMARAASWAVLPRRSSRSDVPSTPYGWIGSASAASLSNRCGSH
jgi:hypothetical protein